MCRNGISALAFLLGGTLFPAASGAAPRFAQSGELAPWTGDYGGTNAPIATNGDALVALNFDEGDAYIYIKPTGGWSASPVPVARLAPASGQFPGTELAVAMSADTVAVGVSDADVGSAKYQGKVYVFERPAGGWAGTISESATLIASDGRMYDNLGTSVAIEAETIVAGAPTRAPDGYTGIVGGIYVFQEPAGGWSGTVAESAVLVASSLSDGDQLGSSVAISGGVVVGGLPLTRETTGEDVNFAGRLLVFQMPAGGWSGTAREVALLSASDGQKPDELGSSVAIDGNTIVAGAPSASVAGRQYAGALYVFVESASGWATSHETAKLTAALQTLDEDGYGEELGDSVAIAGDVVVGGATGWSPSSESHRVGAAYVFARPPAGWANEHESQVLRASDGLEADHFGQFVALGDGYLAVISPDRGGLSGAGYIFGPSSWRIPSPARGLTPPKPVRTGGR